MSFLVLRKHNPQVVRMHVLPEGTMVPVDSLTWDLTNHSHKVTKLTNSLKSNLIGGGLSSSTGALYAMSIEDATSHIVTKLGPPMEELTTKKSQPFPWVAVLSAVATVAAFAVWWVFKTVGLLVLLLLVIGLIGRRHL